MLARLWLVAVEETGQISYTRQAPDSNPSHITTVGPLAYTSQEEAETAALMKPHLSPDSTVELAAVPVDTSSFVQAIYNGFPPMLTDVFLVDGHLYPLTQKGAQWVDEGLGVPLWAPLFDDRGVTGGLTWLDQVLDQVARHLQMTRDAIEAIGALNAAAEDKDQKSQDKTMRLVAEKVRLAVVPEKDTLVLQESEELYELTPAAKFLVSTVGMDELGLPELEFRSVPAAWVTAAGTELRYWAAYALDQGIQAGDVLEGGGPVPLKYRVTSSEDGVWGPVRRSRLKLEVQSVFFGRRHLH